MAAELMQLPGIKFAPTDSELLLYLREIIHGRLRFHSTGQPSGGEVDDATLMIHNCNVYAAEPWNLPRVHLWAHSVGSEAYYFTLRQKKHGSGSGSMRAERKAGAGTWTTSRSRDVRSGGAVVGHSTLLFYDRDGKKQSCGRVMEEYRLPPDPRLPEYEKYAICRVKLNAATEKKKKKRDQKRKANHA